MQFPLSRDPKHARIESVLNSWKGHSGGIDQELFQLKPSCAPSHSPSSSSSSSSSCFFCLAPPRPPHHCLHLARVLPSLRSTSCPQSPSEYSRGPRFAWLVTAHPPSVSCCVYRGGRRIQDLGLWILEPTPTPGLSANGNSLGLNKEYRIDVHRRGEDVREEGKERSQEEGGGFFVFHTNLSPYQFGQTPDELRCGVDA